MGWIPDYEHMDGDIPYFNKSKVDKFDVRWDRAHRFSVSIKAAWEVMEKIKDQSIDKQYKFVDILYGIMKNRGLPKGALMLLPLYIDPLAICRAVLKAVVED